MLKSRSPTALTTLVLVSLTAVSAQTMMSHSGAFHTLGAPPSGTATLRASGGRMTLGLRDHGSVVLWYADVKTALGAAPFQPPPGRVEIARPRP